MQLGRVLPRVWTSQLACLSQAKQSSNVRCYSFDTKDAEEVEVEVSAALAHKIDPPSRTVKTSVQELLQMYEMMQRMRRMEIAADMAYKSKLIRGFCHLYDGQEAVAAGMEAGSTKTDSLIQSYRDHCQYIARGGKVHAVMAELMGKATGATKGVGGSMHLYNPTNNFWGGWGIVGSQVPLGAGLALGHKMRKDGGATFVMYGDGASNQGQVYEAFNIAALWSLPAVFVCENNHYGMGTSEAKSTKSLQFYKRMDYMPGMKVNGMDALAVKSACLHAKAHAVKNGPIVLEMDTYRYHGHSMSDPGSTYRTRDEIAGVRQERDPLEMVRKYLKGVGYDVAQLKQIDKSVKQEVDAAVAQAKEDPQPPLEWIWKNVYQDPGMARVRGLMAETVHPAFDPEFKGSS